MSEHSFMLYNIHQQSLSGAGKVPIRGDDNYVKESYLFKLFIFNQQSLFGAGKVPIRGDDNYVK